MRYGMFSLIIFFAGFGVGWVYAHNVISNECDKLGKFYVGVKVYECTRKPSDNT